MYLKIMIFQKVLENYASNTVLFVNKYIIYKVFLASSNLLCHLFYCVI